MKNLEIDPNVYGNLVYDKCGIATQWENFLKSQILYDSTFVKYLE